MHLVNANRAASPKSHCSHGPARFLARRSLKDATKASPTALSRGARAITNPKWNRPSLPVAPTVKTAGCAIARKRFLNQNSMIRSRTRPKVLRLCGPTSVFPASCRPKRTQRHAAARRNARLARLRLCLHLRVSYGRCRHQRRGECKDPATQNLYSPEAIRIAHSPVPQLRLSCNDHLDHSLCRPNLA